MLKKTSSKEPLGQFEPILVGNMLGGWGFRFPLIKRLAPFGANKEQHKDILMKLKKSSFNEPPAGMH